MKVRTLLSATMLGFFVIHPALAQPQYPMSTPPQMSVAPIPLEDATHGALWKTIKSNFDKDGQGFVSKDNFLAPAIKDFADMDTNGDGVLTKKEVDSWQIKYKRTHKEKEAPQSIYTWTFLTDSFDADYDEHVTKEEFLAPAVRYFTSLDANGDGALLKPEVDAAEQRASDKEKSAAPEKGEK